MKKTTQTTLTFLTNNFLLLYMEELLLFSTSLRIYFFFYKSLLSPIPYYTLIHIKTDNFDLVRVFHILQTQQSVFCVFFKNNRLYSLLNYHAFHIFFLHLFHVWLVCMLKRRNKMHERISTFFYNINFTSNVI